MSVCRGENCHRPIRWVLTKTNGKLQPVDPDPDPEGNLLVVGYSGPARTPVVVVEPPGQEALGLAEETRYMPHHATCPDVQEFRS